MPNIQQIYDIKKREIDQENGEKKVSYFFEIEISEETLKECYKYSNKNAITVLKKDILRLVGNSFNSIFLNNAPLYINKTWLRYKLNQVFIKTNLNL